MLIYEHKKLVSTTVIMKPGDITRDFFILKTFLSNFSVKPSEGQLWFQVWLSYDEPIENINVNMRH